MKNYDKPQIEEELIKIVDIVAESPITRQAVGNVDDATGVDIGV